MSELSPLHAARIHQAPRIPRLLRALREVVIEKSYPQISLKRGSQAGEFTPLRIGVVLSGGQAPGGHNVIAGLCDGVRALNPNSSLVGFIGGPSGVVENRSIEIDEDLLAPYRNVGGFDLIGSGRTKIETQEQLELALATCKKHQLDGLVIVGGDDSNTNAAILADYFKEYGCQTCVIGVPKTIDGDLKGEFIEISFGHDTACRVYSEMIGNLMRDAMSARKYWHFVKLMGRSASHITLECALQTHPNVTLIGEEVAARGMTLQQVVASIAEVIDARRAIGKKYGVVLIPEGLIEFIPEIKALIGELNDLIVHGEGVEQLSLSAKATYQLLPEGIQRQLLIDRDPHGNVQVSKIATEQLLMEMVGRATSFHGISHFFGYEGRSAFPTPFDCDYCYSLGLVAVRLIAARLSGLMASVRHLICPVEEWTAEGIPLAQMLTIEKRHGKDKSVIQKALVDLQGAPFAFLEKHRHDWALADRFRFPGPIQFEGKGTVAHQLSMTLVLESS